MQSMRIFNPTLRAIGIISAVAVLVGGVTFAALTSQATLTNSSISSATANLLLWDGDTFESTAPGFTVTGLVPGTGVTNAFYFKNSGGVPLNITANVPALPGSAGFSDWHNLLVTISSTNPGCVGPATVNTNMYDLNAGQVSLPCPPLTAGAQGSNVVLATEGNYTMKFDIVPGSITGSVVTVDNFNMVFTGVQP